MQMNKVMKSFIIALPVVTMMACSSGPSEEELAAERNRVAQEQAEAERQAREAEQARVQAEAATRMQRQQEMVEEQKAALKKEQTVYFDFDRATIKAEFQALLDKHAEFLVNNPDQNVVIEGHTDQRGTPEYNIALGERRAQAVETYLMNAGVSSSQISTVSYGEEKPAVMGSTEYAMAQNRRGIVVYQ
ncbi:MAG: peptidoglycan-associated lipoprotein [Alteromonadaceae bacterium]|uniref:peptidoglycan-associated lipoprotein Pal n=1 Tax=unclassified Alteromonas TaxID=2614992 RepID=UPI000C394B3F|nr:peptidoglycan-associated lipoprotein Pal [Alteromonas sp. 1_MG-2023]MBT82245.1 peptidoglycan-associated lipoprotein [Alteromonadaceae bacterium]MDO6477161.1 peptidoglycan-associated lipoprotein Pal [Alteromonas sp. 1_MG-2023]MEC7692413.1 peptidoglycan-associated lipoprotein Pal [Pseudomonadota bacterium]